MTAKELIESLKGIDADAEVLVRHEGKVESPAAPTYRAVSVRDDVDDDTGETVVVIFSEQKPEG